MEVPQSLMALCQPDNQNPSCKRLLFQAAEAPVSGFDGCSAHSEAGERVGDWAGKGQETRGGFLQDKAHGTKQAGSHRGTGQGGVGTKAARELSCVQH